MNEWLQAKVFAGFAGWKSVAYLKETTPKILQFEVEEAGGVRPLYLASVISREEKMAWQSFQDVLEHMAGLAQGAMRGFFGLEVLSVDIQAGMRSFNPNDFSRLLINHSKTLGPDQKGLIRYGQLFALLHYRAPADWGKIEVKTHVEFLNPEPASTDAGVTEASVREALLGGGRGAKKKPAGGLFENGLKDLVKASGGEGNALYLVHDLGLTRLWDASHDAQRQRVRAWFEKEGKSRGGHLPEVYYFHAGNLELIKG